MTLGFVFVMVGKSAGVSWADVPTFFHEKPNFIQRLDAATVVDTLVNTESVLTNVRIGMLSIDMRFSWTDFYASSVWEFAKGLS